MKKNWKALVAIAAVVIIVAVAVVIINMRPAGQAAQPEPGGDSSIVAGKFGFPVSKISIGEGGTKKASDGKTTTGYNGTCDSAVQAAANYVPLFIDVNVKTWADQKKTLTGVSQPGPWFEKATYKGDVVANTKEFPAPPFDGGWYGRSDVAAGGMYRVASCEEKKRAVVQVFTGGVEARVNEAPSGFFQTLTLELSWDSDWKISDAAVVQKGEDFGDRVKDGGPMSVGTLMDMNEEATPVLRNELVNAFFENKSRDGWVEYANAKRQ
ncbi:hypothetical protein [Arthrobacter sp. MP_2.3]|uniref:hypothetical protein n=1 Tax=Arthrobacter sp. MP_2.3 TaxID=3349633 RepID=UPI0038D41654